MDNSRRFSHLSPRRQRLVRLFQSTNYGYVHDLTVEDGEANLRRAGGHCVNRCAA
jgi:hypothetical protein